MIVKEPDRVKFASFSKKRPHFRKITIDGKQSMFVKCLKCTDFICKYDSKKGSGTLLGHEKRIHADDDLEMTDDWEEDLFHPRSVKDESPAFSKVKDAFNYPYMVWDHCTMTGKKTSSGLDVRACSYCSKELGASPAYATIHMKECSMVPEEVKRAFMVDRRKRKWMDDESDDDEFEDGDDGDEQEKVVKILTGLLTKRSGGGEMSKKPLRNYTESDFDRELKELAVKKARLEVKALEDGQREMDERCKMYKDIRKAVNVWMEKEAAGMMVTPRVKDILHEAYEDSITTQSVNGQRL